jgi:anti-sigma factor RsiW
MGCNQEKPPRRAGCPSDRALRSWLDGELGAKRAGEIAAHLSACGHCAAIARDDRAILAAVRAAAPSLRGRAAAFASDDVLMRAESFASEEVLLVANLRKVAAVAAMVIFTSAILLGWNSASVGTRRAEESIRAVAIPAAGALIDDENSVAMAFTSR